MHYRYAVVIDDFTVCLLMTLKEAEEHLFLLSQYLRKEARDKAKVVPIFGEPMVEET